MSGEKRGASVEKCGEGPSPQLRIQRRVDRALLAHPVGREPSVRGAGTGGWSGERRIYAQWLSQAARAASGLRPHRTPRFVLERTACRPVCE